jgi:hypothetical protein
MKVKPVSENRLKISELIISYVGREYQDTKLKEKNDDNVRKDTEHLEV